MQSYDARLMSGRLPVLIDPLRLADEGIRLQGELAGSDMTRLRAMALPGSRAEAVAVDLQFERSAPGVRRMQGRIYTAVEVVCQRCLQPLLVQIEAKPVVRLLQPGEVVQADDEDALPLAAPVALSEMVEDELLLAMPMVPVHAETNCESKAKADAQPVNRKEHPFAVLQKLKDKST